MYRICSIDDCQNFHLARNYCDKHYKRWEKYGNPNITKHRTQCIVENCERKHFAKGSCKYHYNLNYYKIYPEKMLKSQKRHLEKYSKIFDMNSSEYVWALRSWGNTIKKLDKYMCKLCDSKENLHAHHIQPKAKFPEISLELDNGITLCKDCHKIVHGFETYENTTFINLLVK